MHTLRQARLFDGCIWKNKLVNMWPFDWFCIRTWLSSWTGRGWWEAPAMLTVRRLAQCPHLTVTMVYMLLHGTFTCNNKHTHTHIVIPNTSSCLTMNSIFFLSYTFLRESLSKRGWNHGTSFNSPSIYELLINLCSNCASVVEAC